MPKPYEPPSPLSRFFSLLRVGPHGIARRFFDQGSRRWTGSPVWKYSRITAQLYVGGQHRVNGWKAMGSEGITAVVNMRESKFDDTRYQTLDAKKYLHLATRDNTPPTLEDLIKGAVFIHSEISGGGKVYIHCGIGIGRAPTQAAAYLIYTGMTAQEAYDHIYERRPFIHLTSRQRHQLDEFEALYRNQANVLKAQVVESAVQP